MAPEIHGDCDPRFGAVREAFLENFVSRNELGAAVCVYKAGARVVDLWAGIADPQAAKPWERDTLVCMMSVGKGLASICVQRMIDDGTIDIDATVARYWPAFGQAGKSGITVKQLLAAQTALLFLDDAPADSLMDWGGMLSQLEAQQPQWEPGTRGAYHSMAAGLLLGGLVQAADGRRIDRFFAEEIAGPLGAEYAFGLDDAQIARTARIVPNDASVTWSAWKNPATNLGRAWHMMPHPREEFFNSHAFRAGLFPSANGHGNPRAVARIYAALANDGTLDGVTIVSPAAVARMRDVQWDEICGMTERPFRYGLGQFVNKPPLFSIGPNPAAFGHPGVGGAIGFADPENGIAFSYAPNFLCEGAGQGDRVPALIEAVYKA